MPFKRIRNISFRKKMTLIFAIVCTFSLCIAGIVYYRFAEDEIVDNFKANAESLAGQLENTLDARLEAVNRRAFAALTNTAFIQPLSDYVNAPSTRKEVALSGEAAYWLKDISLAEPLVHSTFLYTEKGAWDDYTRVRNWDFDFEESTFGRSDFETEGRAIQWMPAMTDEIFQGGDQVIPYVRRFFIGRAETPAYLIIQLDQTVLLEELAGNSPTLGELLITDSQGNYIAGTTGIRGENAPIPEEMDVSQIPEGSSGDIQYAGKEYLVYRGAVPINDWQIYVMKSKEELLASVGQLRRVVVLLAALMIGVCLILVAFLSRQMTSALYRLTIQMNRMKNGELDARFYYPYKDEVGSLAQSFNYMADQVEKSMKKQEEYIAVLKEERDFVEQVQKQKRKAELKALQAQINPHFLYNTLNTITWLASDKGMDEIRILSNSLGKLFRISLSRGAEVIPIRDEVEHVKSYLTIQGIRYAEVMKYEIQIPEEVQQYTILKLVLQPLVENAIYHGIKEKETLSYIHISAERQSDPAGNEWLQFIVEDNGLGIAPEKLDSINAGLEDGTTDNRDGYGIFNVNERIKLYYGEEYGLYYESSEGEWTRAILTIPIRQQEGL